MQNKGYPLRGSFFVREKGYAVIVYSNIYGRVNSYEKR